MPETIQFILNDKSVSFTGDAERNLLWVLRTEFELTGTKYGCGEGFCGACTVLVDNRAERSCQLPVKNVAGKSVLTIEGLSQNGELHPVQQAFVEHDALQCGYCTPGMIMTAASLLYENPNPSRDDIIVGMDENLCRCGGYGRMVDAIQSAAKQMRGGR